MATLDDKELARLEELAAKANKGPFEGAGSTSCGYGWVKIPGRTTTGLERQASLGQYPGADDDARYIAAACNAVPSLVAIIRAQRTALIAWQFQAAGAALALQRLMTAAQAMREAQRAWGDLIGTNPDMCITPEVSDAACVLGDAEDAFDVLLNDTCAAMK